MRQIGKKRSQIIQEDHSLNSFPCLRLNKIEEMKVSLSLSVSLLFLLIGKLNLGLDIELHKIKIDKLKMDKILLSLFQILL